MYCLDMHVSLHYSMQTWGFDRESLHEGGQGFPGDHMFLHLLSGFLLMGAGVYDHEDRESGFFHMLVFILEIRS